MKINNTEKRALINTNTIKNMLRYKTETRPGARFTKDLKIYLKIILSMS